MTRQADVDIDVEQLDESTIEARRERFGLDTDESVQNGGN